MHYHYKLIWCKTWDQCLTQTINKFEQTHVKVKNKLTYSIQNLLLFFVTILSFPLFQKHVKIKNKLTYSLQFFFSFFVKFSIPLFQKNSGPSFICYSSMIFMLKDLNKIMLLYQSDYTFILHKEKRKKERKDMNIGRKRSTFFRQVNEQFFQWHLRSSI